MLLQLISKDHLNHMLSTKQWTRLGILARMVY